MDKKEARTGAMRAFEPKVLRIFFPISWTGLHKTPLQQLDLAMSRGLDWLMPSDVLGGGGEVGKARAGLGHGLVGHADNL
jgi:hypothetical protein